MVDRDFVAGILEGVVHPEAGVGLVSGGFVSGVEISEGRVDVALVFRRSKDPFSRRLVRQAELALGAALPGVEIVVGVSAGSSSVPREETSSRRLEGVGRVLAVASGKGGVGKSTVTAHLARTLSGMGYRVGVLDADIYGPSQPVLFGVEDYMPVSEGRDASERIVPAESGGVKIMSIGLFISAGDALVWRGPMAVNALRQLVRQTAWGEIDFLLVDLPPGTGDVHLSMVHDLELDGAIVVTTPGALSLADVRRGVEMFRSEGISVPVVGVVENMAWFTPAELPDNRYFIFGEGGGRRFAAEAGIEFLGEIPIVLPVGEAIESGVPLRDLADEVKPFYEAIARKVVDKLDNGC
jgi:ATP-binding protein involved in chromosome partitioning